MHRVWFYPSFFSVVVMVMPLSLQTAWGQIPIPLPANVNVESKNKTFIQEVWNLNEEMAKVEKKLEEKIRFAGLTSVVQIKPEKISPIYRESWASALFGSTFNIMTNIASGIGISDSTISKFSEFRTTFSLESEYIEFYFINEDEASIIDLKEDLLMSQCGLEALRTWNEYFESRPGDLQFIQENFEKDEDRFEKFSGIEDVSEIKILYHRYFTLHLLLEDNRLQTGFLDSEKFYGISEIKEDRSSGALKIKDGLAEQFVGHSYDLYAHAVLNSKGKCFFPDADYISQWMENLKKKFPPPNQ